MPSGPTTGRFFQSRAAAVVRVFLHVVVFAVLTALTQVGGLAYLLALAAYKWSPARRVLALGVCLAVLAASYAALSYGARHLAAHGGRVPLPCNLQSGGRGMVMQSPLYCFLNRHYVTVPTYEVAQTLADHMERVFPGTVTLLLDASFPLFDGFPLLPHLSHDDGRKLDLAFYYQDSDGSYLPGVTRSPIGYWAFESPQDAATLPCAGRNDILTFRWNVPWFRNFHRRVGLERERTAQAILWLATAGRELGVSKILLEPHLKAAFELGHQAIRFQGCRATRHDDHIHIEVEG